MIPVPDLVQALDMGLRNVENDWDELRLHVTDLAVGLPIGDGGMCHRGLWLRLQGAEKLPLSIGKLMMFDHGHRIQERVEGLLRVGIGSGDWELVDEPISHKGVFLPGNITGEYDAKLVNHEEQLTLILDYKTARGRAFGWLDKPRESHVLQVQGYIRALDADGGLLLYVDREGQNKPIQHFVPRDDDKVIAAAKVAMDIRQSKDAPPVLSPRVRIGKNKGPDSVRLEQPWQCDYCDFRDVSCPGALPYDERDLGIVGYISKPDGLYMPKEGLEGLTTKVIPLVNEELDRLFEKEAESEYLSKAN